MSQRRLTVQRKHQPSVIDADGGENIDERIDELNTSYHIRRQEAITSELLDVVSGFEVLSK